MAPRIAIGLALTACLLTATPAAPAASGALVESCTVMEPHFDIEVTATLDTGLPATMPLGTSATVTTTATVTIPEVLTSYAYTSLGARTVEGLAQFETDLEKPGYLSNVSGNITKTTVPSGGNLTVQLIGLPQTYTASTAGPKVVKGYVYLTALRFHDASDNTVQKIVVCGPKTTIPAQDLTIDTVTVAAPAPAPAPAQATKTAVTAAYKKHAKKLKTQVTVTNADGTPASGKVSLVLRRGKVKIHAASVPLNGAGVASKIFRRIGHSGHYVVVAEYGATTTSKASLGKAHVTVP